MTKKIKFEPNWTIHPGAIIEDFMEDYDCSIIDLSTKTGWPEDFVENLLSGEISINKDIAKKLCIVFGMNNDFWLNLQVNYEKDLSRINKAKQKEKARIHHPLPELKLATVKV
jgi:addiction module HigA family antidote